jgi:hypothetical protein
MEKLLVAHVERFFVVQARIKPSTFRPVAQRFIYLAILPATFTTKHFAYSVCERNELPSLTIC